MPICDGSPETTQDLPQPDPTRALREPAPVSIGNRQSALETSDDLAGAEFWRSLNERAGSAEVRAALADEFPEYDPDELLSLSRRKFLSLAGASMALAGLTLTGCRRWPKEQVLPYNARPDGTMPGVPEKFASMVERDGFARGLFVTSFDGRPIGVDGSPLDPTVGNPEVFRKLAEAATSGDIHTQQKLDAYVGVADTRAQASVLEMYDPDRARAVLKVTAHGDQAAEDGDSKKNASGEPVEIEVADWDAFVASGALAGKVAVLAEPMSGPTAGHMRRRFQGKFGSGSWHTWTPLNRDQEIAGSRLAFGGAKRAHYDTGKAKVIACFDCDFLSDHPTYVTNARGWAKNRRSADYAGTMNRLYAADAALTPTVVAADDHIQVKPSRIATLLDALANKLGVPGVSTTAELNGSSDFINHLAADLKSHRGASIVVAGPSQPAAVHALVWAINDHLGNLGATITLTDDPAEPDPLQSESVAALAEKLDAGDVETLLILGGNPAFDGPASLNLKEAIRKAKTVVRLGHYFDETSAVSDWHLPMAHALECWGDGRAWDGSLLIQQPIIEPLFGGKSAIEVLAMAVGDELTAGYDLVRRAWSRVIGGGDYNTETRGWGGTISGLDAEKQWRAFVHDGIVRASGERSQVRAAAAKPASTHGNHAEQGGDAESDTFEVVFRPGPAYDGRHANNGWLQEAPQVLTKVTWDTPAHVAVTDAKQRNLHNGDHVKVTVTGPTGETSVELPCFVNPGQAPGTVVLPLGGGREVTGNVGTGVGQNVYPLRAAGITVGKLEKARGHTKLATTSDHHLIDPDKLDQHGTGRVAEWALKKRAGKPGKSGYLIKEATLADYLANKHFATDGAHGDIRLQLFSTPSVTGDDTEKFVRPNPLGPDAFNVPHAWGMTIDLSTCIGCNACVVACQAENNIPVVGKDQVLKSREMHWLRIDTYFKGDPAATSSDALYAVNMPVACVQCENAPCEQVCPVAATVHDTEGLNTMVYNRCIGTRYCSNNCPYKVRRFNWFDYHSKLDSDFFRSKHVGVEVQNKPWLAMPDMQQGDVVDQVRRMVFNPDVTMRMRGVMEKCTYCTQRIARAKISAKAAWARRKTAGEDLEPQDRLLQDGEVRTACQTACPTDAIVFGNLNDPDAQVSQLQQHNPRSYRLLEELNSRPRTLHMGLVRNPALKPGSGKAKKAATTEKTPAETDTDHPEPDH